MKKYTGIVGSELSGYSPVEDWTPQGGTSPIVRDITTIFRLNAPAKWVAWLKRGTPFEVQIDETGKTYKARVTALNGRIDAVSQSIELEAMIDQKASDLLAGMSGVANFPQPR